MSSLDEGASTTDQVDPSTVTIRYATASDRGELQAIFNHEVTSSTSSWEWLPLSNEDWHEWFQAHTDDDHVLLVAEVGGQVAGFAGYGSFRSKAGYVSTVEDSIFLHDRFQRHGLGTALLAQLLAEARLRSVHSMVAAVTSENQASLRLHTNLGFRQVGHLPQIGHKFGRWLDLTLLQIILDDRAKP
ncbi:MAG: GNAT family N-acetyltransferase [Propionibacteriaceae bacterium]|jgi:phosphinothricin acetyltransferase|nr:GNAT family N-acetyltransferase [Propionibacteriaceae bacterium]